MPEMDGVAFLRIAREVQPDSVLDDAECFR
jgi:hypothetical protein